MSTSHSEPKWVLDLDPDLPLAEALSEILEHRLTMLLEHVPGALERAHEDPEHVHQVRVWSRRLTAAVEALKENFPHIGVRKVSRWLGQMRRMCGTSRDLDVRLEFLAKLRGQHPADNGLEMVEQSIRNQRAACQPKLTRRLPVLSAKLHDRVSEILADLAKVPKAQCETYQETAHAQLRNEAARLWKVAAPWLHQLNPSTASATDLHSLRITTKKFRYAAELFSSALPETFLRDLYPRLQELQGTLGDIQDAAASAHALLKERRYAEETLVTWFGLPDGPCGEATTFLAALETLLQSHRTEAAQARAALSKRWPGFIGPDFRDPLAALIGNGPAAS